MSLKGNVDNAALLEDYITENYYLFVNVSSSEGIPVSIMEASSVGIPCLATDVGGTGEIISDGVNGLSSCARGCLGPGTGGPDHVVLRAGRER